MTVAQAAHQLLEVISSRTAIGTPFKCMSELLVRVHIIKYSKNNYNSNDTA